LIGSVRAYFTWGEMAKGKSEHEGGNGQGGRWKTLEEKKSLEDD